MKKNYVNPKMTVVELKTTEIIALSNNTGGTIPDAPFQKEERRGSWSDYEGQ